MLGDFRARISLALGIRVLRVLNIEVCLHSDILTRVIWADSRHGSAVHLHLDFAAQVWFSGVNHTRTKTSASLIKTLEDPRSGFGMSLQHGFLVPTASKTKRGRWSYGLQLKEDGDGHGVENCGPRVTCITRTGGMRLHNPVVSVLTALANTCRKGRNLGSM